MSDSQERVGCKCWYREWITPSGCAPQCGPWKGGSLLFWSTNHVEYEEGPGPFPVGVIEDDTTHDVTSIPVDRITFAAIPGSQD